MTKNNDLFLLLGVGVASYAVMLTVVLLVVAWERGLLRFCVGG